MCKVQCVFTWRCTCITYLVSNSSTILTFFFILSAAKTMHKMWFRLEVNSWFKNKRSYPLQNWKLQVFYNPPAAASVYKSVSPTTVSCTSVSATVCHVIYSFQCFRFSGKYVIIKMPEVFAMSWNISLLYMASHCIASRSHTRTRAGEQG